jgi:hypothetical protein
MGLDEINAFSQQGVRSSKNFDAKGFENTLFVH